MTWLPEHVRSRYASGHVIVIPADHRGYEHTALPPLRAVPVPHNGPSVGRSQCVTLRGAPICDCGMYALDWTAAT